MCLLHQSSCLQEHTTCSHELSGCRYNAYIAGHPAHGQFSGGYIIFCCSIILSCPSIIICVIFKVVFTIMAIITVRSARCSMYVFPIFSCPFVHQCATHRYSSCAHVCSGWQIKSTAVRLTLSLIPAWQQAITQIDPKQLNKEKNPSTLSYHPRSCSGWILPILWVQSPAGCIFATIGLHKCAPGQGSKGHMFVEVFAVPMCLCASWRGFQGAMH